ncbi:MAG: rhomboid family intramembrane serine protease [Bdellovibrionales bacterium]|nr:rhomboid family intramembrane serine protease [Bdellovibrionales bacterium]
MILIGELKDIEIAKKIVEDLKRNNIDSEIRFDGQNHKYQLWIHNKEHAQKAFDTYRLAMGHGKTFEIPQEWQLIQSIPVGPLTKIFIIISILLFVVQKLSDTTGFIDYFRFADRAGLPLFKEILSGQIWRLWTPIFLHFSLVHILFNMLWLKDLGKLLEYFHGRYFLGLFILLTALLSNTGQYIMHGPFFGGMSGVVYAMLGFIWTGKKLNPDLQYGLPKSDLIMMIVWFFLCAFNVIPQVANMAHAVGLSSGMLIAVGAFYKKAKKSHILIYSMTSIIFTLVIVLIDLI